MGWPDNVTMDVWIKFSGHQKRKIGHAGFKTKEEWAAEWRTWYRKENIPAPKQKTQNTVEAVVIRTPEEQAEYDLQQRRWYLKNGIQHKTYNPDGITVKEACA